MIPLHKNYWLRHSEASAIVSKPTPDHKFLRIEVLSEPADYLILLALAYKSQKIINLNFLMIDSFFSLFNYS